MKRLNPNNNNTESYTTQQSSVPTFTTASKPTADSNSKALTYKMRPVHEEEGNVCYTTDVANHNAFTAKIAPQSDDHERFAASRKWELGGLIDHELFIPDRTDEARDHKIMGS